MLTLTDVRGFVNNSAYFARGRVYAQEGCVRGVKRSVKPDGSVLLTANVRGLGETYKASAHFDERQLYSCGCTCPAFGRSGVMCKHVAALLIVDCEQQSAQDEVVREEAARRESARLEAEGQLPRCPAPRAGPPPRRRGAPAP